MIGVILASIAIVGSIAGVIAAIVMRSMWERNVRQVGSDGYPHNLTRHRDQCPCVRCTGIRDRRIRSLEIEMGMREPDPEPEGRTIVGSKIRAATITADKIYSSDRDTIGTLAGSWDDEGDE